MIVMLNFFSFILDLTPCIPYSITFAFPGLFITEVSIFGTGSN